MFEKLGKEKLAQLADPRNGEVTLKIGGYHCIDESVTLDQLFDCGGIVTLEGEVPVDRSRSGGFLGIGGQEDGGVIVQGARVIQSFEVAGGIIHEVDDYISPSMLWRYIDQLRYV